MTDQRNIPAYPNPMHDGMTLRDYFAGKAMAGLLAADVDFAMSGVVVAKLAMQQADAMLEARK